MPNVAEERIALLECRAEVDAFQQLVGLLEGEDLPERKQALEERVDTLWIAVEALSER